VAVDRGNGSDGLVLVAVDRAHGSDGLVLVAVDKGHGSDGLLLVAVDRGHGSDQLNISSGTIRSRNYEALCTVVVSMQFGNGIANDSTLNVNYSTNFLALLLCVSSCSLAPDPPTVARAHGEHNSPHYVAVSCSSDAQTESTLASYPGLLIPVLLACNHSGREGLIT